MWLTSWESGTPGESLCHESQTSAPALSSNSPKTAELTICSSCLEATERAGTKTVKTLQIIYILYSYTDYIINYFICNVMYVMCLESL